MTVFGRDASNFDGAVDFAGLGFFTHKATEGTTVVHDRYGPRLAAARDFGVPVLGAYHVVRTPGSGGNGSLSDQLAFWINYLDNHTPWWQDHPHFMLQVDAEKWPYDNVSASVVKQFAAMLVAAGGSAWKVTYASRGQYGDSLRGIVTPLWNADYRGGPGYPGDSWQPGWAPYSGQTPVLLQYTSTPYDKNAFRGSLDQLRALVGGHTPTTMGADMALTSEERAALLGGTLTDDNVLHADLRMMRDNADPLVAKLPFAKDLLPAPGLKQLGEKIDAVALDAHAAANRPTVVNLTEADRAAIAADVGSQVGARIDALAAQVGKLLTAVAAGDQAEADALKPPA